MARALRSSFRSGAPACHPRPLQFLPAAPSVVYTDPHTETAMIVTKIRKVGNLAVMTLTTEMLTLLDAKAGDRLYVVRTDDGGLKLMTEDPELKAALAAAEVVMDENRDLLRALA